MPKRPVLKIKKSKNGEVFVSLVGGNGEKIMNTETYASSTGARNSAQRILKIVPNAKIEDSTAKKAAPKKIVRKAPGR